MYEELVERLREAAEWVPCIMDRAVAIKAADAIEELANRMRWTLCKDKQPPNGQYLVCKLLYGSVCGYDVGTYAEDLSKIDKYDFPAKQYKGVGGWFDYDSETGYYQTNVYAWMKLPERMTLPEPPEEE